MPVVKNVSGGPLDVPMLGRMVDDGETVTVPDTQPDGESPLVWPDNRWEEVKPRHAGKSSKSSDDAGEAE